MKMIHLDIVVNSDSIIEIVTYYDLYGLTWIRCASGRVASCLHCRRPRGPHSAVVDVTVVMGNLGHFINKEISYAAYVSHLA
jgi:hypothetical protein